MKNLKLGTKIWAVLSVPLLGILIFAIMGLSEQRNIYLQIGKMTQLTGLAEQSGLLIHELQKERGRSSFYGLLFFLGF